MLTHVSTDWLQQKGTLSEFERTRLEQMAAAFNLPLERVVAKFGHRPFGHLTEPLRAFAKKKEEGDELWSFSSHCEGKLGCCGFAIVRAGEIEDTFVTMMA